MDFVSKALGLLPFTLGEQVEVPVQLWKLYDAVLKRDNSKVSVFVYDQSGARLADNATSVLRKLKLPGVVKYIETVDRAPQFYVVTERVVPYDYAKLGSDARKYVLKSVLEAVNTLNSVAKVSHNGLCSMMLMQAYSTGLPTLVGFEFASTMATQVMPNDINPASVPAPGLLSTDLATYQFGMLVKSVLPEEKRLVASLTGTKRPTISKLSASNSAKIALRNPISDMVTKSDEIMLLSPPGLAQFCEQVREVASAAPELLVRGTLLTQLLLQKQDEAALPTILLLISLCTQEFADDDPAVEYIVTHFGSMSRVVRVELLRFLPKYINLLSSKVVQQKIMPKMPFGFSDTELVVKQASVAASEFLAKKLNSRQLNSDLLRLLSRTLSDGVSDVRALTITILCRIAPLLDSKSLVSTALAKALRDPSPKCRNAALLGVAIVDVPPREIAEKLLGAAALGMLDENPQVAGEAWHVTNELLEKVQSASTASGPVAKSSDDIADSIKTLDLNNSTTQLPMPQAIESVPSQSRSATPDAPSAVPSPFSTLQQASFDPHSEENHQMEESAEDVEEAWGWGDVEEKVSEVDEDAWGWED